ncbi:PEP-CTERM/exosortase system-associated acyltransferase [Thiorhodococcus minor]|uniref:PEP-CTERM/exosortase system-associated acyltransferase n=1 Tax=Thiorhodococcus minor TaxID=57489 RepID=A0A6M0K4A2_9GAMM|nr:PEP-CTERM/exosortase system-associated acyltransferase [Thiorhodococcus minor]NEV63733.1 PEP-CTERM/exosortase system-associated acyltransferase [Thiorhodococcus minor]
MARASITERFDEYFQVLLATSPEQLEQVYQVRYEVFCQEFHYLAETQYPDHLERDEYDDFAQHALMIHRASRRPVGCIRLIKANQGGQAYTTLPFERHYEPLPDPPIDPGSLRRDRLGEMSRLAAVEAFRRRQNDEKKPVSLTEAHEPDAAGRRSSFPFIPVGLFMTGMSMFLRSSTDIAFAMMEPRLARLLQRFGVYFTQAGELVDYHGPRAPFFLERKGALDSLLPEVSELLSLIDTQLFAGTPDQSTSGHEER